MKNILIVVIGLTSVFGFSQSKSKDLSAANSFTITKAKLLEMKLFSDMLTDLPTTISYLNYEITHKTATGIKIISGSTNELSSSLPKDLKNSMSGSKVYLDIKYIDQKKSFKSNYIFYIKE